VSGFVSGSSILIHWSSCQCFRQYHAIFIIMALQYSLKSGILMTPALDFAQNCFGYLSSFVFPCISGLNFLILAEYHLIFDRDYIEHIDCFW
jgi:hypothetical protein